MLCISLKLSMAKELLGSLPKASIRPALSMGSRFDTENNIRLIRQ